MLQRKVFMDGEEPILPEEARALGHFTCFEFNLDLFIQSPVLTALTWSSPAWRFFPHVAYSTGLPHKSHSNQK